MRHISVFYNNFAVCVKAIREIVSNVVFRNQCILFYDYSSEIQREYHLIWETRAIHFMKKPPPKRIGFLRLQRPLL